MPLIDNIGSVAFGTPSFTDTPFHLSLEGAENLFADLPGADSSFSGASWSGDEEALDLTPFVPPVFGQPEPGTSSSDEQQQVFSFQPSPELMALEAVAEATENLYSAPLLVPEPYMPVALEVTPIAVVTEQPQQPQQPQQQQQPQPVVVVKPTKAKKPKKIAKVAAAAKAAAIAAAAAAAAAKKGTTTKSGRPRRKRTAATAFDDAEEYNAASDKKGTRKSRRTASNSRPSRTAAKLAAIKSKTTRAAQTKLKRKAASTLTKTEIELAGTLDLSRDELLNMTSDALEAYAQRLAAERPLTAEEQKRFKRQRRLIKNRESAQLSRLRKKAYVDELEKQIAECEEEKERFKKKCEAQEKDLEAMRGEISYLRDLVAQHPGLAQMAGSSRQQRLIH